MINDLVAVVSLVVQLSAGAEVGTASGFFYTNNSKLYFVTNKHVVKASDVKKQPDILRLKLHKSPTDLERNGFFEIELYKKNKHQWLEYKKDPQVDVVAIPISSEEIKKAFYIKALSKANFLPENLVVSPGDDVFVIGFPRGVHDQKHNLPIFRNALIASVYGVSFNGLPMFLIDANLHPGTSGSPVITKPKNVWIEKSGNTLLTTGINYYFLGVHSASLSVLSEKGNEPLGLGSTWNASIIQEIVDQ